MNCPNCGHHVPVQRRIREKRKATAATRIYKRVFMRARRRGISFEDYCWANLAAYNAGRPHDREVLEVAPDRKGVPS